MGRNKRRYRDLPPRMRFAHNAYFYADARGGRKPWVLIGRTRVDALLRYAQLEAAKADRRDFNLLLTRYEHEALVKKAATTQRVYATHLKPLKAVFGAMHPNDITQPLAYEYLDKRGTGTRGRQEIAVLASVLRHGIKLGWVTEPRLRGMEFDTIERRKRYLTDAELAAILSKAESELVQAVRFLHYTALRTIDARRVRWSDWKADGLHVRVSKTKSALVFDRTAGLEALMAELRQRRIGSMYVIADRQGRAWTYKRLYEAWSKAAPEDANLHDLRRKRLTDLARERGIDFAQSLAAHSDPRMTQTYVSGEQRVAV